MKKLENKVAVVYSDGTIGGSIAKAFAREGANVYLTGRTRSKLDIIANESKHAGFSISVAQVDALDEYAAQKHLSNVIGKEGKIDISFNAISGGSSGIEVSAVVASASIGSVTQMKTNNHPAFRKELICAGVAAGVTVLFNSPLAGAVFALEVILKKISKTAIASIAISVSTVWLLNTLFHSPPLFAIKVDHWNFYAFPYFILLGILSGLNSVYLTKSVLFFKSRFSRIAKNSTRILIGSLIISICLLFFPQLYGDGYHAMRDLFQSPPDLELPSTFIFITLGILLLKPIVTSATLASGGDGGVFAPSLFIGAFLGVFVAFILNNIFAVGVIPMNFMVIGMAAVLSASLHAPFTAVFLACGLTGNYVLIIPALIACLVAKLTAETIIPYTVYSYKAIHS